MSEPELTSAAEAARAIGVTPRTITQWVAKGQLPEGPWTLTQVIEASKASRQRRGRGSLAAHGTASRWRAGCQCQECARAHNTDTRTRREGARIQWWNQHEQPLLKALANGAPFGQVLSDLDLTAQAVTAHRRRDATFRQRLDRALMAGRDPDLAHGAGPGWRAGCRCPECRTYHEATR